jgi:hypothetical protein
MYRDRDQRDFARSLRNYMTEARSASGGSFALSNLKAGTAVSAAVQQILGWAA